MNKFQNKYRIPSARASWHEYDGGIYYVTICTKNMKCYFGGIDSVPQMNLTEIGKYTTEIYKKTNEFYPYAEMPLFVVMPNHIHAIIIIDDAACTDAMNRISTMTDDNANKKQCGGITGKHNPMLKKSLGTVIRGLNARITRYANKNNIIFQWQSRFHDRIVRDQNELNHIATYIDNNVVNWHLDSLNSQNRKIKDD